MRYIDTSKVEEKKVTAELGDFIFADGCLMVITKAYTPDIKYKAIILTGKEAFDGAGVTANSIEKVVNCLKGHEDFELIKSDEMKLVREV